MDILLTAVLCAVIVDIFLLTRFSKLLREIEGRILGLEYEINRIQKR